MLPRNENLHKISENRKRNIAVVYLFRTVVC